MGISCRIVFVHALYVCSILETLCKGLKCSALGLHCFISEIFHRTDRKFLDWLHHLPAATLVFPDNPLFQCFSSIDLLLVLFITDLLCCSADFTLKMMPWHRISLKPCTSSVFLCILQQIQRFLASGIAQRHTQLRFPDLIFLFSAIDPENFAEWHHPKHYRTRLSKSYFIFKYVLYL